MSKDKLIVVPFSGSYESPWFEPDDESGEFDAPFRTVLEDFAKEYVPAWNEEFKYETDIDLGLEYERVEMPREYNFTTDRIFASIPESGWRKLVGCVIATPANKSAMSEVAKRRHTSRDGFFSFYDADWESWGTVISWDHNQLETLLLAVMRIHGLDEYEMECRVMENSSVREAIQSHVVYNEVEDEE